MRRGLAIALILLLFPHNSFAATFDLQPKFAEWEKHFELPSGILGRVAKVESGCNARATAGGASSASGLFQWTSGSWREWAPRVNPKYGAPNARFDPLISGHVTAFRLKSIMNENGALIQKAGIDMTLGIYLGHFMGNGGARAFLNAYIRDPRASWARLFPKQARANPTIAKLGSLQNILRFFSQKLSSSCTSAENYSATPNLGPLGSNEADAAVLRSPAYQPGPALYQDPERDYAEILPPRYNSNLPVSPAGGQSLKPSSSLPGLSNSPTLLEPLEGTMDINKIFTSQDEESEGATTSPHITVPDILQKIASGTPIVAGTKKSETSVTIVPISSHASELQPSEIPGSQEEIYYEDRYPVRAPSTFPNDSVDLANSPADLTLITILRQILDEVRVTLENMLSFVQPSQQ